MTINSNSGVNATQQTSRKATAETGNTNGDGYSGSVATLDADGIYAKNPALCAGSSEKEMSFLEVAGAAFVGVAAFACCCSGNARR